MRDKRRFRPFLAGFAALGLALFAESAAQAQPKVSAIPDGNGKGFDTHLFRPALDSKGFFPTNGTDILGKNDISFGLVIDYGREPAARRGPRAGRRPADQPLVPGNVLVQLRHRQHPRSRPHDAGEPDVGRRAGRQGDPGGRRRRRARRPTSLNGQQWFGNEFDSQTVSYIALHGKLRILRVERGFGLAVVGAGRRSRLGRAA